MPKDDDIQKHTLNLRRGDFAYIESMFRSRGIPASLVIRTLIANWVDAKRAQETGSVPETLDISMETK